MVNRIQTGIVGKEGFFNAEQCDQILETKVAQKLPKSRHDSFN